MHFAYCSAVVEQFFYELIKCLLHEEHLSQQRAVHCFFPFVSFINGGADYNWFERTQPGYGR
jgi:hypothetical protein